MKYVIVNKNGFLFWSNTDGWVDISNATQFTKDETKTFGLPKEADKWMDTEEVQDWLDDLEKAAEVYENLLVAADGGGGFDCDSYEASTCLALMDPAYAEQVKAYHEELYSTVVEDDDQSGDDDDEG